ncbi:IucA/IucC family protein [Staphylococcus aureus]
MSSIDKPYHVKLPVDVQATSAVRTVSTVTTCNGAAKVKLCFTKHVESISSKVAMEPFGEYAMLIKIWHVDLLVL